MSDEQLKASLVSSPTIEVSKQDINKLTEGDLVLAKILLGQNEAYGRLDTKLETMKGKQGNIAKEVGEIKTMQRSANHSVGKLDVRVLALETAARLKKDEELEWKGLMRVPRFFIAVLKYIGFPSVLGIWYFLVKLYHH